MRGRRLEEHVSGVAGSKNTCRPKGDQRGLVTIESTEPTKLAPLNGVTLTLLLMLTLLMSAASRHVSHPVRPPLAPARAASCAHALFTAPPRHFAQTSALTHSPGREADLRLARAPASAVSLQAELIFFRRGLVQGDQHEHARGHELHSPACFVLMCWCSPTAAGLVRRHRRRPAARPPMRLSQGGARACRSVRGCTLGGVCPTWCPLVCACPECRR